MPSRTKKATEASQTSQEDVSMTDAPQGISEELLPDLEEQRIRIVSSPHTWIAKGHMLMKGQILQLPGSTETAASFEFLNEDHTLGNALRYIIMKKCVCSINNTIQRIHLAAYAHLHTYMQNGHL
jgi:hypothetical protein